MYKIYLRMKNNSALTTSLPKDIIEQLNELANRFNIPKNQLIEKALRLYFGRLKRAEYIRSFQSVGEDPIQAELAEEGINDYLALLNQE